MTVFYRLNDSTAYCSTVYFILYISYIIFCSVTSNRSALFFVTNCKLMQTYRVQKTTIDATFFYQCSMPKIHVNFGRGGGSKSLKSSVIDWRGPKHGQFKVGIICERSLTRYVDLQCMKEKVELKEMQVRNWKRSVLTWATPDLVYW